MATRVGGWRAWRGLMLFWGMGTLLLAAGFGWLQWSSPVVEKPRGRLHEPAAAEALPARHGTASAAEPTVSKRPGQTTPGPIAAPDPALLEPARTADGGLPRIAADGRIPGQVYAGGFTPTPGRPRIAVILVGFGLNGAADEEAVSSLPSGISLAVSPYAAGEPAALGNARKAGHELLLSIPLEPQGFPLNDPGAHALLSTASPKENHANLVWALGRSAGYAGTTGALGPGLYGERFSQLGEPMSMVATELAARGLFYVDARIEPHGALPAVWSRATDKVIDNPPSRAGIEASLAELERIATDRGAAVGLVSVITPVALDRLKAWSRGLGERGFELAPASAVMRAPPEARPANSRE